MAKKFIGSGGHSIMTYLPHLLAVCGVILMIIGVATMQGECGSASANSYLLGGGTIAYLSPVTCAKFFSLDWFISVYEAFVLLLILIFLLSRTIHKWRAGLNGLLLIATVLTIFMCNTWYKEWGGFGSAFNNKFTSRAKVTFAGALLASIANILMMMSIGLHDESASPEERAGAHHTY